MPLLAPGRDIACFGGMLWLSFLQVREARYSPAKSALGATYNECVVLIFSVVEDALRQTIQGAERAKSKCNMLPCRTTVAASLVSKKLNAGVLVRKWDGGFCGFLAGCWNTVVQGKSYNEAGLHPENPLLCGKRLVKHMVYICTKDKCLVI
jgi:hypothetical protein